MKQLIIIISLSIIANKSFCQIPIAEIVGVLEISLQSDSTSIYIGQREIDSTFYHTEERNHNVIIGFEAAEAPSIGENSVIIGHEAAQLSKFFDRSVIIGDHTAEESPVVEESIIIGSNASVSSDEIEGSTFVGYRSGNVTGNNNYNTGIGHESMNNSSGTYNSHLGWFSGSNTHGSENTGVGAYSNNSSIGNDNTSIGSAAGSDSQGNENISIGYEAGAYSQGNNNISIGKESGLGEGGNYNTNIGYESGQGAIGSNNIYIGRESGKVIVGNNNIVIGQYQIDTMSNQFVVSDTNSSPLIAIDRSGKKSRFNTEEFIISSSSSESPIHFLSYKNKSLSSFVNITGKTGLGLYTKLSDTDYGYNLEYDAIVNKLNLKTSGFNGAGSKMTWVSNGNVGINTEFPQELLHVDGDSRIDGEQEVEKLIVKGTTGEFGIIASEPSLNNSNLHLQANNNIVLELDKNGGSTSSFSVKTGANTILELLENGNLSVDGTLVHTSDINRKHDINTVNSNDILEKVQGLKIATWKYKGAIETHIGPMAQDFYAAFGLGAGETTIATVDADGVALAAIKALATENESLKDTIMSIQLELTQIKKQINEK